MKMNCHVCNLKADLAAERRARAAMTADARALANAYNLLRDSGILSYGRLLQVEAIARRVLTQNDPEKEQKK